MSAAKCGACKGRGWVHHDDVPMAVCAACSGFGSIIAGLPASVSFDGVSVRCDVCPEARGEFAEWASFVRKHQHAQEAAGAPERP